MKVTRWNGAKIKQRDLIFYIAYTIFMVFGILRTTVFYKYFMDYYMDILRLVVVLLALPELSVHKLRKKEFVGAIICLLVTVLQFGTVSNSIKLTCILLLFIYCSRDKDFDQIARYSIYLTAVIVGVVILLSSVGIVENYRFSGDALGRQRECIGFLYPLYPAAFVLNISLLYFYIKRQKMKVMNILVVLLVNYYIYSRTVSRLSFYLAVVICILALLLRKRKHVRMNGGLSNIISWCYVILPALSVLLAIFYSPDVPWMNTLNQIFGRRLYYSHVSLIKYGVGLTSRYVPWTGFGLNAYGQRAASGSYLYVDNYYVHILQENGLLFFFLYCVSSTIVIKLCRKMNDIYLFSAFAIIALHGLIDNLIGSMYYNTFWLVIGTILMRTYFEITNDNMSPNLDSSHRASGFLRIAKRR